jgi:hypothetical protein
MNKKQQNRNRENVKKSAYNVNPDEVPELLPDIAALENHTGKATVVRVMSGKEAGIFVRDNLNANPSIDNGALIVIK